MGYKWHNKHAELSLNKYCNGPQKYDSMFIDVATYDFKTLNQFMQMWNDDMLGMPALSIQQSQEALAQFVQMSHINALDLLSSNRKSKSYAAVVSQQQNHQQNHHHQQQYGGGDDSIYDQAPQYLQDQQEHNNTSVNDNRKSVRNVAATPLKLVPKKAAPPPVPSRSRRGVVVVNSNEGVPEGAPLPQVSQLKNIFESHSMQEVNARTRKSQAFTPRDMQHQKYVRNQQHAINLKLVDAEGIDASNSITPRKSHRMGGEAELKNLQEQITKQETNQQPQQAKSQQQQAANAPVKKQTSKAKALAKLTKKQHDAELEEQQILAIQQKQQQKQQQQLQKMQQEAQQQQQLQQEQSELPQEPRSLPSISSAQTTGRVKRANSTAKVVGSSIRHHRPVVTQQHSPLLAVKPDAQQQAFDGNQIASLVKSPSSPVAPSVPSAPVQAATATTVHGKAQQINSNNHQNNDEPEWTKARKPSQLKKQQQQPKKKNAWTNHVVKRKQPLLQSSASGFEDIQGALDDGAYPEESS